MIKSQLNECQQNVKQDRATMTGMRPLLLLLIIAGTVAGTASADFRDKGLEKSLKPQIVKSFKQQSPKLTITSVYCLAPSSGTVSHCKAYFTVSGAKGYYPVTAKLHDLGGTLSWTAQSPKCLNTKTKKYAAC
jgi:hypothetical protein